MNQTSITKAPEFSVVGGHNSTSNMNVQTPKGQNKLREDPARLLKREYILDPHSSPVHHRPKGLRNEHCHTKQSLSPESANRSESVSPIPSDLVTEVNSEALLEPIKTRGVKSLGLTIKDLELLKMAKKKMEMATYFTRPVDPSDNLAFECWKWAVSQGRAASGIPRPRNKIIGLVGLYQSYHDLESNSISRLNNNNSWHEPILWNVVDRRFFHGTNSLNVTQNPWQRESAIFLTKNDFSAPKYTTRLVHVV